MSAVMAPPFMVRCETELQVFFCQLLIFSLSHYIQNHNYFQMADCTFIALAQLFLLVAFT
jgi:hypothetical protein